MVRRVEQHILDFAVSAAPGLKLNYRSKIDHRVADAHFPSERCEMNPVAPYDCGT